MCSCYLQKQVSHCSGLRVVRLTPVALGVYVYALLGLAVCVHGSVCSWASIPATVLYTCPAGHLRKLSRSSLVHNAIVIIEVDTGLLILGYPGSFKPKHVHDCELSGHIRRYSWFKLFCPKALRCFHVPHAVYI